MTNAIVHNIEPFIYFFTNSSAYVCLKIETDL